MKAIARARSLGGSLIVTLPKEFVREEGVQAGELIEFQVEKIKKSFFGIARGIGHFTKEDEMNSHD